MKRAARGKAVTNPDNRLFAAIDLPAALGLLTRLPVPVDGAAATARGAAAVWAYPLAGVVLGGLQALAMGLLLWLDVPVAITAALVLALAIIVTGAMHEDGLADSIDGLWGGWDKTRRLAIMKDSHIGTYGVIALVLTLLLRWTALGMIASAGGFALVLVVIAALSRAAMVGVMAALPHAREDGLSRAVGRPAPRVAWVAVGIGAGLALVTGYLGLVIVAAAAACLWALIARAKIGGQTGDILGATQQWAELALLIAVVTALA
ncbi:adenosylcobinamide-GDP ribazoletransferase [Yoonia vestfoldensis]|uniref:Adenosylcobinamide-GDP ribazoletransferase n=1 Tax=Yoonia vestfoldensis TaxID=245188 RepID=A0A1Y0EA27_9RHOB|nr:adenosylcobinamide-GDP ribazoletransferase [Yoonia vestfoldensis]ARU00259.1 adenosylcobinamide-GDP ribazoletransferase [Yoonia vestfoldensis]